MANNSQVERADLVLTLSEVMVDLSPNDHLHPLDNHKKGQSINGIQDTRSCYRRTSPLYVYPSMPLKSPTEDDYLGIYIICLDYISLIGVIKYATIALKADDQGKGGTFALRSLLCRNMKIGILPSNSADSSKSGI